MDWITTVFSHPYMESVLHGLERELTRYTGFSISMYVIIVLVLTPMFRSRKIRKKSPGFVQMQAEFFRSLRTIGIFIIMDLVFFRMLGLESIWAGTELGWSYGPWLAASVVFGLLWHDTWFYWVHRLMHHRNLYRAFHLTHHRSVDPSPFTAYSFAVPEALMEYMFIPPMILLVPIAPGTVSVILLIMFAKNVTGHSGFELFPRGTLQNPVLKHLTTVTHHDMHHANGGGNFGLYFTWWDRWMGTEHKHYAKRFEAVVAPEQAAQAQNA